MDELAADLGMVVDEKHHAFCAGAGVGRGETRRTCADDKKIAVSVELRIVGRRAVVRIDSAEVGHGANRPFVHLPPRAQESLVLEARGQERRKRVDEGGAIGRRRRCRIDRTGRDVALDRFGGRAKIRGCHAAPREVDDRVRLLGPRAARSRVGGDT